MVSAAVGAALLLVGCSLGTEPSGEALARLDGEEYGVVAAPPLPLVPPTTRFDPAADLATGDGEVVVRGTDRGVVIDERSTTLDVDLETDLEPRAVSSTGERIALFAHDSGTSHVTVVDLASGVPDERSYALAGLVEPEAFSTDGELLFVIDHQVAAEPGAYRVRPLDLATGELLDILGPDKVPFDDDMNGVGRRQAWAPDWTRLYTLYIRQTHHHHSDGRAHAHGEAGTDGFVHVLDLDDEWAFCLDLPPEFGGGTLDTTALAVSADGTTVAVADRAAGRIAFASTEELVVTRTVPMPPVHGVGDLHLALIDDRLLLTSGTTAEWFDATTMAPVGDGPFELAQEPLGITTNGAAAWVWLGDVGTGPVEIDPPDGSSQRRTVAFGDDG